MLRTGLTGSLGTCRWHRQSSAQGYICWVYSSDLQLVVLLWCVGTRIAIGVFAADYKLKILLRIVGGHGQPADGFWQCLAGTGESPVVTASDRIQA